MKKSFTLVETVISISIMSIITIALFSTYLSALSVYSRMGQQGFYQRSVDRVIRKISEDLRSITTVKGISKGLEGYRNKVSFTAKLKDYDTVTNNPIKRISLVSYKLYGDEVVRENLWGRKAFSKKSLKDRETIIEDIEDFSIRYGFHTNAKRIKWKRRIQLRSDDKALPDYIEIALTMQKNKKKFKGKYIVPIKKENQ